MIRIGDSSMMMKTGDSLRMTMMKVGDCEDNAEGWELFKDDEEG